MNLCRRGGSSGSFLALVLQQTDSVGAHRQHWASPSWRKETWINWVMKASITTGVQSSYCLWLVVKTFKLTFFQISALQEAVCFWSINWLPALVFSSLSARWFCYSQCHLSAAEPLPPAHGLCSRGECCRPELRNKKWGKWTNSASCMARETKPRNSLWTKCYIPSVIDLRVDSFVFDDHNYKFFYKLQNIFENHNCHSLPSSKTKFFKATGYLLLECTSDLFEKSM